MINLSNLKAGQSKDLGEVTVTKMDGNYELVTENGTATLTHDKADKVWVAVYEIGTAQVAIQMDGVTAKTVVETAMANWPTDEGSEDESGAGTEVEVTDKPEEVTEDAVEAPQVTADDKRAKMVAKIAALVAKAQGTSIPEEAEAYLSKVATLMAQYNVSEEELRRSKAAEAGEKADEEPVITWSFAVNVQGGHATHRVASFTPVIQAMGAEVFFTHQKVKGEGYKSDTVTIHVIAQPTVIEDLKQFLPIMELAMERLAEKVSREVSHEARLAGQHHSGPGCHARRGFMRGFGSGIAHRVRQGAEEATAGSTSTALVVQDRAAAIAQYMATFHPNLKPTKAQKYDSTAWVRGHAAGVAFVAPQVEEGSPAKELQNA
jgi:hypothetical protein